VSDVIYGWFLEKKIEPVDDEGVADTIVVLDDDAAEDAGKDVDNGGNAGNVTDSYDLFLWPRKKEIKNF